MSDLALTYVRSMARNNRWANHRLLTACAALSQADLDARRTSFFPSLTATLNHILIIDRFYVDALERGSLGPAAFANQIPCPSIAELAVEQAHVDARLIAFCDALTPEALGLETRVSRGPGRWQVERTDRLLLHLFQHDIHHRGQAHAMLAGTKVPPPQLDEFFSAGDASLRAPDLAALGWTEADVWPGPA